MTQSEMLCKAAAKLAATFSAEDLTVAAWELYPIEFCISGHRNHANLHAVRAALSGKCGPVKQKLIQRVGSNKYKLTPAVKTAEPVAEVLLLHLPHVCRMLDDETYIKVISGMQRDFTYSQMLEFLGHPSEYAVNSRLRVVREELRQLMEAVPIELDNGRVVTESEALVFNNTLERALTAHKRRLSYSETA